MLARRRAQVIRCEENLDAAIALRDAAEEALYRAEEADGGKAGCDCGVCP